MSFKPKMTETLDYYRAMPDRKLDAKIGNLLWLQRKLDHCLAAARRAKKERGKVR